MCAPHFLCGVDTFTGQNFKHCWCWIEYCLLELFNIFAFDIAAYALDE
jgi:hypothetical protein